MAKQPVNRELLGRLESLAARVHKHDVEMTARLAEWATPDPGGWFMWGPPLDDAELARRTQLIRARHAARFGDGAGQ